MTTSIFFIKSDTQNLYLFNMMTKSILLLHPYMYFVYHKDLVLNKNTIAEEDLNYYQEKIRYYENYGLISQDSISGNEFIEITKVFRQKRFLLTNNNCYFK